MSVAEMKQTILEKVSTFSEKQLIELSEVVNRLDNQPAREYDLLPHIESIVSEREEVMKRLAQ